MPDAKLLRSAMPIKLTQRADQDIVRMFLEGSKRFGISQAQNYRRGFERACAFIADNASSVRERTEYSPPVRIHRHRSHVIIFRIEDADIVVLRVRHGAEDWMTDPIGANDQ